MALQFSIDPATGVYKPPVTVFNGGSKKRKTRKSKKTRRSKGRKMTRRR